MLYGAVDLGKPERQEFFQEARAGLKQAQMLKMAKDEQEKKSVAAAGNIPLVSSANMWDSHAKAAQKAAKDLRDRKDEMMKTEEGREQYQTMLNELEFFIEQGKDHFRITSPVLENNINIARQGGQYENRMRDEHDVSWYEERMAEADSDLYDVSFIDGHLMIGGMSVDDPQLMNNSRFDSSLVRMEPVEPGTFWRNNIGNKSQILDTNEAEMMVKDAILSSSRTQMDVAEWWRNSQGGVDESGNELPSAEDIVNNNQGLFDDAIEAYTQKAIDGWSPSKEKKRSGRSGGGKSEEKTPDYLDEGRFSDPVVSTEILSSNRGVFGGPLSFSAFPEEIKETEVNTAKETYTFPGSGFKVEDWSVRTVEYDTASDPAAWVITLSGDSEEQTRIIDNYDTISPEDNNLSSSGGYLDIGGMFEAENGKNSWGNLLYKIRQKAVDAAGN